MPCPPHPPWLINIRLSDYIGCVEMLPIITTSQKTVTWDWIQLASSSSDIPRTAARSRGQRLWNVWARRPRGEVHLCVFHSHKLNNRPSSPLGFITCPQQMVEARCVQNGAINVCHSRGSISRGTQFESPSRHRYTGCTALCGDHCVDQGVGGWTILKWILEI
jgi:hypothetical protein